MHRISKPSPSKPSQPKKKLPSPESLSFISNLLHTRLGLHLDLLEQTNIAVINDIRKVRTSANQLITKTAAFDPKASELFMHNEPFPDLPVNMTFQTEQAMSALPVLTFGDAARNYTSYSQNDTLQDLSPVPRFSNSTNFSPDFSPEKRPGSRNDTQNHHHQQQEENKNQNGMKLDPYAFLLEAIEDLQKLTRKDVLILSSHINPAPNIKTAMDALCIILGKNQNWSSIKKMLEEPNIISNIISFNFERLDKITLQKIETFVNSPSPIDYEKLKSKSLAAAAFWKWVLAVHYYYVAVSHNEQEIIDHLKNQPQESPKRVSHHQEEDAFTELENQLDSLDQIAKKVKRMTKRQIDEIFAYKIPPGDVKRVVEILCLLFGEKPTWYSAKKAFQQKKILEKIDSLKLEEISDQAKEKLKELQTSKSQKHPQLQCIEILENYLMTVASIVCTISTKTFDEEEQELFDIHKEELTMECIEEESENYSQDRTARGPTPHREEDFDQPVETQPEEPIIIKEALKHFIGLKKEDFTGLQKSGSSHIIKTVLQGVYLAIKGPELELINLKEIKDLDFRKVTKDIDQIMSKILSYNYDNKSAYIITKLREYLKLSNLSMEKIKKESPVALALWNWLHSIVKYHEQIKTEKLVASSPPPKMRKSADIFHSLPNKTPTRVASSHKKLNNTQSNSRITPPPQEKEKLHLEFTNRNVNEYMKEFYFFADDFKDFKRTISLPKPLEIALKVYSLLTKQPYISPKNFPTKALDLNKQMDIDPESLTETTVKTVRKEISECLIHEDQLEQLSRLALYIWKWAKILIFLHDRSLDSKKVYHHQPSERSLESHYQSLLKAKSEISGIRQRTASAPEISNLLDFIEAKKMVMKSLLQNSTTTPNESFHKSPEESRNFYKVAERSRSQENMIKISDLAKIATQPPSTKLYNSNEKSITLPDNFRPQTPDTSPVLHNRGGHLRNGSLPGSLQTSPTQKNSIIRSEKSSPTIAKIKPRISSTAEKIRVSSANPKTVKKEDITRQQQQPWKQNTPVKQKSDHFELKRPSRIASSSSGIRAFTTSGEEKEPIRVNKRAPRASRDEEENVSRSNQQEARENQMKRYQELMKNFQQLLKTDPDKKLKFELTEDLVHDKILSYQKKVNDLEALNKTLKNSGVSRAPIKKSFLIRSSTKKVIQLVNSQWITNLLNQRGWSDATYNILVLLFMMYNPEIEFEDYEKLDIKENIRNFITENQTHIVENLLEIGKYLNLKTKQKVQIEKFLQDKREIFNSTSYEKSDQFCWAISQLLKDVCEHLGVLGMESVKDISTKEKIFLYNQEKVLYYKQKVEKLKKIEESQFGSRTSKK